MADAESKIIVTVDSTGAVTGMQAAGAAVEQFAAKTVTGTTAVRTFALSVRDLRGAMTGLGALFGGIEVADLVKDLIKVNAAYEQTRLALIAGANSALAAGADFTFLRGEAQKLGLPVAQLGIDFARLTASAKGTALQGQPVRDLFDSLAKTMVATGRSTQNMQRGFYAVSEMLSTVQMNMREVRMLSIQIPGGFRMMAEAWAESSHKIFDKNTPEAFMEALRKKAVDAAAVLKDLPNVLNEKFGAAFGAAQASSPAFAIGRFQVAVQDLLYTLGQSGFMREFIGMLNDIATIFAKPDMQKSVTELARGLGDLMGVVREAVDFVVEHLKVFAAAFAGFVGGIAVLALKSFFTWLLRIAEVGAIADLIASPWLLVAGAIGIATAALIAFGGNMVTIGGQTARVTDYLLSGFDQVGQLINKAVPGLGAFGASVKSIFDSIGKGDAGSAGKWGFIQALDPSLAAPVLGFFNELKILGNDVMKLFGAIGSAFKLAFVDAGPIMAPAVTAMRQLLSTVGGGIAAALNAAWNTIRGVFSYLAANAQTVEAVILTVINSVTHTLSSFYANMASGLNALFGIFELVVTDIIQLFNKAFKGFTLGDLIEAVKVGAVVIIDTFEGILVAVSAVFDFIAQVGLTTVQALQPVFVGLGDIIGAVSDVIGQFVKSLQGIPGNNIKNAVDVFTELWHVTGEVLGVFVAMGSYMATAVGAALSFVGSVIRAIGDVINGVIAAFAFNMKTYDGAVQGASKTVLDHGSIWIKVGDVIVGAILTVAKALGVVVEEIGVAANAIIQLVGRAVAAISGIGTAMQGIQLNNLAGVTAGLAKLHDAVSAPLAPTGQGKVDFASVVDPDNFHVVDKIAAQGSAVTAAWDKLGKNLKDGFTQVNTETFKGAQAQVAADQAKQAGTNTADAYLDGLVSAWSRGAAARTASAQATDAAIAAQKAALDQQQRAAWDADNAAVDRNNLPDPAKTHGKKTPAERAADEIKGLRPEIATDNAELIQAQRLADTGDHIKAIIAAENDLKKTGLDLTYAQAEAQGGIAKQLADTVVAQQMIKDQVQKSLAADTTIGKNQAAVQAAKDDLSLMDALGASSQQYKQELAEQKAIREAALTTSSGELIATKAQAQALAALGDQHAIQALQVGETAKQVLIFTEALTAAEKVANDNDAFKQQTQDLIAYTNAAAQGSGAVARLTAEIAGQEAVMKAYGDAKFDPSRLTDPKTGAAAQALFQSAQQFSQLGGSAASLVEKMRQLHEEAVKITDPLQAQRDAVVHTTQELQRQLDVWLHIQEVADSDALTLAIASGDPAGIKAATDNLQRAHDQYVQATKDLQTTSQRELQNNSSSVVDVITQHYKDMVTQSQQFSVLFAGVFDKAIDGMSQSLATFITTGKLNFAQMATSIIADIVQIIAKWMILRMMAPLMGQGSMFPMGLTGAGGMLSMMFGGGAAAAGATTGSTVGALAGAMFANGGVMTAAGVVPLRRYAGGGVASSAQVAMFGEGSSPEAYVPLPDGRTIPVSLAGGKGYGSADAISRGVQLGVMNGFVAAADRQRQANPVGVGGGHHFESNVHITNNYGPGGNGQGQDDQHAANIAKRVHGEMKNLIIDTIMDQSRPGGTLNPLGAMPGANISRRS